MPVNSQTQQNSQDAGRSIQPVNIWVNGQVVSANIVLARIISDNLMNAATFYYQLFSVVDSTQTQAAEGNLVMDGQDYQNWGQTGDINQEAYVWVATQLNLVLV